MQKIFLSSLLCLLSFSGFASVASSGTVSLNAVSSGWTDGASTTAGSMSVSGAGNRAFSVFDIGSIGIPAGSTITAVSLTFTFMVSGTGTPVDTVFGCVGDISILSSSALYSACHGDSMLYAGSWGTTSRTLTITGTTQSKRMVQNNMSGKISLGWVESAGARLYSIIGAPSPMLNITYVCNAPTGLTAVVSSTTVCTGATVSLTGGAIGATSFSWAGPSGYTSPLQNNAMTVSTPSSGIYTMTARSLCGSTAIRTTSNLIVNTPPAPIVGATSACSGTSLNLTNAVPGGSWASSTTSIATIGSATGMLTTLSAGTSLIKYTIAGCPFVSSAFLVKGVPATITGTKTICTGTVSTLACVAGGGTWSSDNSAVAAINATTGVMSGVSTGTANITYNNGCGIAVTPVLIKTAPAAITGPTYVCLGTAIVMTESTPYGTWSKTNVDVNMDTATTHANLTGTIAGIVTIKYSTGCGTAASVNVTVRATPVTINGTKIICSGTTSNLSCTAVGGTWSSDNTAVATISATGVMTGVSAGTANITYDNGCGFVVAPVKIKSAPAAISGSAAVCPGSAITLSETTPYGMWTRSNTHVNVDTTGIVTGVSAGTVNITYSTGCGTAATKSLIVNPLPNVIGGAPSVCVASAITLIETTSAGTWSTSNATIASVSTSGVVSGVAYGGATISYTKTGCTVTKPIMVNAVPAAITGPTSLCSISTITLMNAVGNGTWSSSTTGVATVDPVTGVVTPGSSFGTALIVYNTGCGSVATLAVHTVTPPGPISGASLGCQGMVYNYTNGAVGGVWTSSNPAVVSINSLTGNASASAVGNVTLNYSTGCGTDATKTLGISTTPAVITGVANVCAGAVTTLSNAVTSGTWTSGNPLIATIDIITGRLGGVAQGYAAITYSTGCGTAATFSMLVKEAPVAITAPSSICVGSATIMTDDAVGGIWSSVNPAIINIDPVTGSATAMAIGAANINYSTGCGMDVTVPIRTTTIPDVITGVTNICTGGITLMNNSVSGGTWTTSSPAIAEIDPLTGELTGVSQGYTDIRYSTGCGTDATFPMMVKKEPITIVGPSTLCAGSAVTMTDSAIDGVWTSSDPTIVGIDPLSGSATGIAQGITNVRYSTGCGADAFAIIRVTTTPGAITGTSNVCAGSLTTLSNSVVSGTWSASDAVIATIDPVTGELSGVSEGYTDIIYSTGCGTDATVSIVVKAVPTAIEGPSSICLGTTGIMTDGAIAGLWSSSDPTIADVNPATGEVTTVISYGMGTTVISYSTGCGTDATTPLTVNASPLDITGGNAVCNGSTLTLSNAVAGGSWNSSDNTVADIDAASGIVSGVSAGIATINYTTGCGTDATMEVNVEVAPAATTGTDHVCTGTSALLHNIVSGGSWTSSDASIASVDITGNVTGVSEGSSVISYSLSNSCGDNTVTKAVAVQTIGKWLGVNADWNDGTNWPCGTIPDAATNVVIPVGVSFMPSVSSSVNINNLNIQAGASLAISSSAIVSTGGDLTNSGSVTGSGKVKMNGVAVQVIHGNGFIRNMEIANAAGVSVAVGDSIKLKGTLTLTSGVFTTNNALTLYSDVSGTGRIAAIADGASISGNVTVQSYIAGGHRTNRFLGHPFNSSIALSQLENYIDITGNGGSTNGFTTTATNAPSCFWYHTRAGNSSLSADPGYIPFTSCYGTPDTNNFKQYEGVRILIRGARGEGLDGTSYTPSAVTISMKGNVNTGNQTITMHKGSASDYNQISNPYPSPVNIGNVITRANTAGQIRGSAFYVWNPYTGATGAFEAKTVGSSYVIGENTSYQVRAMNEGSSLSFLESDKAQTAGETLLRTTLDHVSLRIYDANYHPWDAMEIKFDDKATIGEDNVNDAGKAVNPDLNFYSLSGDNTMLSIDVRPYEAGTIIPLGLTTNYGQEYIIKAQDVAMPAGGQLYLHDKLNGKYTLLTQDAEYKFEVNKDAATQGNNRFELTTAPAAVATIENNKHLKVSMTPNPATDAVKITFTAGRTDKATIRLMDISGVNVYSTELGSIQNGSITVALDKMITGLYMVEVNAGGEQVVQRLIKE